jgi:DNA-directed RNA polymerase subunit F
MEKRLIEFDGYGELCSSFPFFDARKNERVMDVNISNMFRMFAHSEVSPHGIDAGHIRKPSVIAQEIVSAIHAEYPYAVRALTLAVNGLHMPDTSSLNTAQINLCATLEKVFVQLCTYKLSLNPFKTEYFRTLHEFCPKLSKYLDITFHPDYVQATLEVMIRIEEAKEPLRNSMSEREKNEAKNYIFIKYLQHLRDNGCNDPERLDELDGRIITIPQTVLNAVKFLSYFSADIMELQ